MSEQLIHPRMRDAFRCFSRNGRWGTCVDCPRDSDGHAYPESCEFTKRSDHNLDVDALAQQHKAHLGTRQVRQGEEYQQ